MNMSTVALADQTGVTVLIEPTMADGLAFTCHVAQVVCAISLSLSLLQGPLPSFVEQDLGDSRCLVEDIASWHVTPQQVVMHLCLKDSL